MKKEAEKKVAPLILRDEEGVEHEYDVLFTFESDETHKNYIAYTANEPDGNGGLKVYASIYDPTGKDTNMYPLETEREMKVIEEILSGVQKKVEEAETNEEDE